MERLVELELEHSLYLQSNFCLILPFSCQHQSEVRTQQQIVTHTGMLTNMTYSSLKNGAISVTILLKRRKHL
jgi:hypothetical protein